MARPASSEQCPGVGPGMPVWTEKSTTDTQRFVLLRIVSCQKNKVTLSLVSEVGQGKGEGRPVPTLGNQGEEHGAGNKLRSLAERNCGRTVGSGCFPVLSLASRGNHSNQQPSSAVLLSQTGIFQYLIIFIKPY